MSSCHLGVGVGRVYAHSEKAADLTSGTFISLAHFSIAKLYLLSFRSQTAILQIHL